MAETPPSKHDYAVQSDGWVQSSYRKKGDTLTLTEAEAQYDVLAAKLVKEKPKAKPAAKPATGKT